ncbi:hypothetical protein ACQ3G6_05300 [Allorhizobium undicola]|uniref:hypothetical protein n=1 Tax=Allorhizobium undicola TaxID=78527 RepID=UPI003D32BADA
MFLKVMTAGAALLFASVAQADQYSPAQSCSIGPAEFQSWFSSGEISRNGAVTFAPSARFPTDNTKCDFYKWGHQMFLWMTSPAGSGLVLTSPTFYNVNFGANGGYFIQGDSSGYLKASKTLKVQALRTKVNTFHLKSAISQTIQPDGQAGGRDTLMSLNGSIVYYSVHANDMFAWFNTAVINGDIGQDASFPSTQADLDRLKAYILGQQVKVNDADAMTMEIKASWIDADKVVGKQTDYVTIDADVPNYQGKVGAREWTIGTPATVKKKIALVGMHVVGSVKGHPEMVWATFEHRANAPDNDYYVTRSPQFQPITFNQLVPYNSVGQWNFMQSNGTREGALQPQMKVEDDGTIIALTANGIRPNNTYRVNPWGNLPDASSANNNTQLVTLNRNIDGMLATTAGGADARSNYIQIGSVWTQDGSIPTSPTDTGKQIGSLLLANATMETYHQEVGASIPDAFQHGCFGCHNGNVKPEQALVPTNISHLFSTSNQPLVPK